MATLYNNVSIVLRWSLVESPLVGICGPLMPVINATKSKNCGPRSLKFVGCWPIRVEQFAVGAQDHVIDYWTFHQPAEDSDVYSELLRISAAIITCVIRLCVYKKYR